MNCFVQQMRMRKSNFFFTLYRHAPYETYGNKFYNGAAP